MVLSTMVKLKTIGLANKIVLGALINGALIGATVVAGAAIASRAKAGKGGFRGNSPGRDVSSQE